MKTSPIDWLRSHCFLALLIVLIAAPGSVSAQPPTPEKVDRLIELLSDPEIKTWLQQQNKKDAAAVDKVAGSTPAVLSSALDMIRAHMRSVLAAIPRLPAQFQRAWIILSLEFEGQRLAGVLVLIGGFIVAGLGLEWLVRWSMRNYRRAALAQPSTTPQTRLRSLALRVVYSVILLAAFVVGSAGVFLIFDWPPLLREIVLGYLTAAIITRAAMMLSRVLLLPPNLKVDHAEELRALPMNDARAAHWYRWIAINVGWFAFVGATLSLLATLGFDPQGRLVLATVAGFIQLLLILAAVWLRLKPTTDRTALAASWLMTLFFVTLWLLQLAGQRIVFWLVLALVGLPFTIMLAHRIVNFLLRPSPVDNKSLPPLLIALVDRSIRLALIVAAAILLARAWHFDISMVTEGDTLSVRLLRGGLNAALIILAADFGWSLTRALIARKLGGHEGSAESGHASPQQARLRTLLPIFQNILFAVILVITILMVLSSLGIEIGPLIAGAGVVGVAIGFGAQTLVKDVISGMFYLLDDAFRVGEYIQSGNYRGTVENFSLRSVKLRHHRGYLFTVPFGELGAIQNMSRDWVIDKFSITVAYDTDLDKARKLIKKIGLELAADPEFSPHVIEPLKLQGVEKFGDYGIELRMKLKTKPGEQFTIRRKAFVVIKKTFEENGIHIPFPTVYVQEGKSPAAAAGQIVSAAKRETPG